MCRKNIALLFLCLLAGPLLCGLAQVKEDRLNASILLYQQGLAYYQKASRFSSSQNHVEEAEDSLNKKALDKFIRFLQAAQTEPLLPDSLRFSACVMAGELAQTFDSLPQALMYYNQALAMKRRQPDRVDTLLFKPCVLTGVIYYQQSRFDSAIRYFQKADDLQKAIAYPLQESGRLYNLMGSIHYEHGNYKQAANYFQKAVETVLRLHPDDQVFPDNYRMNVATSLFKLENYDSARVIYRSLLRKGGFFRNQIYQNLGQTETLLGWPQKALYYLQQVHYTNQLAVGLNNNIAGAYLGLKKFDSAGKYLALATEQAKIYYVNSPAIDYGRTLKITGDLQKETGHFKEALSCYQQALHQFYPAFTGADATSNPVRFSGAFSYINLFQTLAAKAETLEAIYRHKKENDKAALSLATYKAAFSLMAYVEQTYESDEARLFLAKIKYALRSRPIDLAIERYQQTGDETYLSLLYEFDQQNKAAVLSLNRQLNTAFETNAPPLTQREHRVKSEIARLSIKAMQTTDSGQLATVNNAIRDYEIELGKLRQSLYPAEERKGAFLSLSYLQNDLLDTKTALVSYHLSAEKLTTLLITKTEVRCYQQPLSDDFTRLIQQKIGLLKGTVKPVVQERYLYDLLLANVPLGGKEQLIIIPDDVLSYLPFESLQNKEGKFLVEQVAVQYQFSTALLTKNETDFSNAETLSLAPFSRQSYTGNLPVLSATAQETAGSKGTQLLDTNATKEAFLRLAPSFPVLHLATHAVADSSADRFSYIAFWPTKNSPDNLLYAQEIYNLPLQKTGLVILGACETGAGNLVKGEGILSLSRAFAYAGCPNVITSLWRADDFSTAYLTGRIHRYLHEGYSIAKATQQAKLDYLRDKTINPRLKHPYYWSHLVFAGAYQPEKRVQAGWYALITLLFLLSVIAYKTMPRRAGHR